MKRVISVMAGALLLTMVLWCESFSLAQPYDYQYPYQQDGDDHTWGGEQEVVPPTPSLDAQGGSGVIVTGIGSIDVLINTVFREWMNAGLFGSTQIQPTRYYIISKDRQDSKDTGQNANNKGNLR